MTKIYYRRADRFSDADRIGICWVDNQGNEALINLAKSSGVKTSISFEMGVGGQGSMWADIDVFERFMENAKLFGYEFVLDKNE